jgi:hypothetical protein
MRVSNPIRKLTAILAALALIAGPCAQSSIGQSPAPAPAQEKPHANPARAQKAIQAGKKAEKVGDWQAAYEAYVEAFTDAPGNKEAEILRDTARFHLVQQHMDGAERELLAGNNPGAQTELQAAIQLDPSYHLAKERLAQVIAMNPPKPLDNSHEPQLASPVQLRPQPGTHTFDVRGDVQSVYQAVAKQFGVVVQFDPDLAPGRPTRFRVPDVDFETAMNVLSAQTHTFWTPFDETRIIVADDQPTKRKQFEQLAIRTFVLPASLSNEDMTDTMRMIREIVGITRTSLDTATHELTVRDTPRNIAIAEELINQIEQGHGELVLEVELLEVDKSAARLLGILPPTSSTIVPLTSGDITQLENATSTQALEALIASLFGSAAGGGGLGGLLPPLVAFGGGSTIFFSTLGNTQANFSQTYSTVHSAQRLLLRAQDNKPATFFLGQHYPITLSLLSTNLANTVPGSLSRSDLPLPTGTTPTAVITASLRNNSIMDLIVANQSATGDGTVVVFLGNGDGTFAQQQPIPVGKNPVALVAEDFNGDGNVDLAVVNQGDNTVSLLFGNGDNLGDFPGTSTSPNTTVATGTMPSAIFAADFNADGHLDFAVTNFGDDTVSIFLNNANNTPGSFAAVTPPTPTGKGPHALATAGADTNGNIILAVVNQTDSTVSTFLVDNTGTLTAKAGYSTGSMPFGITVTDFNGDNFEDLAISNQGSNTVSVFLGNGDGTFQPKIDSPTGNGPTGILTGNFTGSGTPDLIVANLNDGTVSVLIDALSATTTTTTGTGVGTGSFSLALTVATGAGPIALASADFNGDSVPDLAVAAQTADVISIILNSTTLNTLNETTQTPYPGSEYEDIGLKVKATPRIHAGSEVTLQLSFEIRSLSGSNINGIPIITNRTLEQTVRVRENEPTLLAGIVDVEEMQAISGWPGTSQISGAGRLTSSQNGTTTDDELLIVITPRLLRAMPHPGRPIYAGRDTNRSGPGQP